MLVESFQNMYPDFQSFRDTIISNHNNTNIDVTGFDVIHDYFYVFFFVLVNGLQRFFFLDDNDF